MTANKQSESDEIYTCRRKITQYIQTIIVFGPVVEFFDCQNIVHTQVWGDQHDAC